MYDTLKDLNTTLKNFKGDKKMTDDMKMNILSEKFKDVEKKINSYQEKISESPTRNDKKRIAITESIKAVAIDNRQSRERIVNQINTSMVQAIKALDTVNKNLKELKQQDPNGLETKVTEMELKARTNLSANLGNCEPLQGQDRVDAEKDLTRIVLAEKIKEMKVTDYNRYKTHEAAMQNDPEGYLNDLTEQLYSSPDFQKIVSKVSLENLDQLQVSTKVKNVAEDMEVFKTNVEAPVEKKAQPKARVM